ncbi:MAG: signal peptide peptidase SppA [Candidatus Diapherotrites archaeon]|nr:signal peptide peptidase SppA [Candidatus Diapherotrites archaeon]
MNKNKSKTFALWKIILTAILLFIGVAVVAMLLAGNTFFGTVAVIPIEGEISLKGQEFSSAYSALEIVEKLEEAKNNPTVTAILLEINSPGGSIVASRQIVEKILEVKKTKPVVAWIGEIGASGAYYVASACNKVYADSDSITGSIGVISVIPNAKELLEKIGIKFNTIEVGKYKAMGSFYRDLNSEEKEIIRKILQKSFARFKNDILSFRRGKIDKQRFEMIADGRIISGEEALQIGLIDRIATREEAVIEAAKLAGIYGKPSVVVYRKEIPPLFNLLNIVANFQEIKSALLEEPKLRS